jgi:hypothetical protein
MKHLRLCFIQVTDTSTSTLLTQAEARDRRKLPANHHFKWRTYERNPITHPWRESNKTNVTASYCTLKKYAQHNFKSRKKQYKCIYCISFNESTRCMCNVIKTKHESMDIKKRLQVGLSITWTGAMSADRAPNIYNLTSYTYNVRCTRNPS